MHLDFTSVKSSLVHVMVSRMTCTISGNWLYFSMRTSFSDWVSLFKQGDFDIPRAYLRRFSMGKCVDLANASRYSSNFCKQFSLKSACSRTELFASLLIGSIDDGSIADINDGGGKSIGIILGGRLRRGSSLLDFFSVFTRFTSEGSENCSFRFRLLKLKTLQKIEIQF